MARRQLARRPRSHALLIQSYAQWVVLRRARRDHHRGRYTHMSGQNDRGRLRQTLYLLDWLAAQNHTIGDLTQPILERWLTEAPTRTKREVASFLAWTAARKITPKRMVPEPPRPDGFIDSICSVECYP
ncbi:hypothetical protein [Actinoplanes awajinensis]|uniref:hypothetical protein n=1 Tax=Actinoplanes awajinensis TaxID=135946 RepID=UPI0012FC7B4B|nr:hypothetical protein [Actinoplanes awajinensis]